MKEALPELKALVDSLSKGLRDVSHSLFPAMIEDLGVEVALEGLVDEYRASGVQVSLSLQNVPSPLPLDVATTLFRIAQEGLGNATKHAPAKPVYVTLAREGDELHLQIKDEGPGFSIAEARQRGGLGLLNMQERARLVGGKLSISTRHEHGTSLLARVPLSAASSS